MREPWCIYIDIEGFKTLLPENELQAITALSELMRSIFRIGRLCYPMPPDRICAHQFGDGFVIESNGHEPSLDRCVAIAATLMQWVALTSGLYTRAAIAEGELADIQSCYPDEVLACREGDDTVSLAMGIMTVTPVMGTGLTRSVGLAEQGKPSSSGPLLIVAAEDSARIDGSVPRKPIPGSALVSVDWVHMQSKLLDWIQTTAGLSSLTPADLEAGLAAYCANSPVTAEWKSNVRELLNVPLMGGPRGERK